MYKTEFSEQNQKYLYDQIHPQNQSSCINPQNVKKNNFNRNDNLKQEYYSQNEFSQRNNTNKEIGKCYLINLIY